MNTGPKKSTDIFAQFLQSSISDAMDKNLSHLWARRRDMHGGLPGGWLPSCIQELITCMKRV